MNKSASGICRIQHNMPKHPEEVLPICNSGSKHRECDMGYRTSRNRWTCPSLSLPESEKTWSLVTWAETQEGRTFVEVQPSQWKIPECCWSVCVSISLSGGRANVKALRTEDFWHFSKKSKSTGWFIREGIIKGELGGGMLGGEGVTEL